MTCKWRMRHTFSDLACNSQVAIKNSCKHANCLLSRSCLHFADGWTLMQYAHWHMHAHESRARFTHACSVQALASRYFATRVYLSSSVVLYHSVVPTPGLAPMYRISRGPCSSFNMHFSSQVSAHAEHNCNYFLRTHRHFPGTLK